MSLFTSPLCGLCNYQVEQNEPVKTHTCTQKFHEKCWSPFYNLCSYCFKSIQIIPLAFDLEQLVQEVSQKRLGGNLTSNHLILVQTWLSQYKDQRFFDLDIFLSLILNDLLTEVNPIQAASRHAAFFDILFANKAIKERNPHQFLNEENIRRQLKEKEIKPGIEFLKSFGDSWMQTYIEAFQNLKLRSPYPHRVIEADKTNFRMLHRANLLSQENREAFSQLMHMSEQELLVLNDMPELKQHVQKHLAGHRMFRFFMRFTALLVYSMALVAIGSMLKNNTKN